MHKEKPMPLDIQKTLSEPTEAEMATVKDKEHEQKSLDYVEQGIGIVIPAFLTKQELNAAQGYIPIKIRITKPNPDGMRLFSASWIPPVQPAPVDPTNKEPELMNELEYRVVKESPGKALDALITKLNKETKHAQRP